MYTGITSTVTKWCYAWFLNYERDTRQHHESNLPVTFCCDDLSTGEALLPVATLTDLLRDVLAFLSLSMMNFFVRGCPSGDSNTPRLTQLPLSDWLWRGNLLTSGVLTTSCGDLLTTFGDLTFGEVLTTFGDLLMTFGDPFVIFGDLLTTFGDLTFGDLLMTFGDPFVIFGDLLTTFGDLFVTCDDLVNSDMMLTSDDPWTASALLGERSRDSPASVNVNVPLTVRWRLRSGQRWVAVVTDSSDRRVSETLRLTTSELGLIVYRSLLTGDDCQHLLALNLGLFWQSGCLADARRRRQLALVAGDGLWRVNVSLAAESIIVLSGVALCHKHHNHEWHWSNRRNNKHRVTITNPETWLQVQSWGFMSHSTQTGSFWKRSSQRISWVSTNNNNTISIAPWRRWTNTDVL